MNKAEIMTLLSGKTGMRKESMRASIRLAIMAGKLSGILLAADREIDKAEHFSSNANWTEMLKIMEGTLDKETNHRADSSSKKSRDFD